MSSVLLKIPRWAPHGRRPSSPRQILPSPAAVRVSASSRPGPTSACAPSRLKAPAIEAHNGPSPKSGPLYFEERIEKVIYSCRFLTIFGVIGSLMGSVICFLKGCMYVISSFGEYIAGAGKVTAIGGKVILMVVEAIDIYLIGTVMLVFGMGLYELFISNFDIAKTSSCGSNLLGLFQLSERPKWLEIQSVNELKTKLGHVIVMVLLIGLFEKSRKVTISSSIDLLCFAASILLSSSCLYLLAKLSTSKDSKHA